MNKRRKLFTKFLGLTALYSLLDEHTMWITDSSINVAGETIPFKEKLSGKANFIIDANFIEGLLKKYQKAVDEILDEGER